MFSSKICEVSVLICKKQNSSLVLCPSAPGSCPPLRSPRLCRDLADGQDAEQHPVRG